MASNVVQLLILMVMALPFLKLDDIDECWVELKDDYPIETETDKIRICLTNTLREPITFVRHLIIRLMVKSCLLIQMSIKSWIYLKNRKP